MSTWSCPACRTEVPVYDVACGCGYSRAAIDEPPASRLAGSPITLYPWLGRALLVLRIGAYLSLAVAVFRAMSLLWTLFVELSARESDKSASAILIDVVLTLVLGAVSFILQLGLVDAGALLHAVHRRVGSMDERNRGAA